MHPPPNSSGSPVHHGARGFTAIELMVTIGIAAILAALAAPSFTGLMERWRVRQAAEGLQSTLYYARSEAMKRGGNVVMQKLPNGTNGCSALTTQEWSCGWVVCADTNGNGACGNSEPVLQRVDAPINLDVMRTGNGASVAFNRWGMPGSWLGFSIQPHDQPASDAIRGVCMSSGGRVRVIPSEDVPCSPTNN